LECPNTLIKTFPALFFSQFSETKYRRRSSENPPAPLFKRGAGGDFMKDRSPSSFPAFQPSRASVIFSIDGNELHPRGRASEDMERRLRDVEKGRQKLDQLFVGLPFVGSGADPDFVFVLAGLLDARLRRARLDFDGDQSAQGFSPYFRMDLYLS